MLRKNQNLTVTVDDMNNLGAGIAREEGMVIFVPGGVTGDRLFIKIIKTAKDYAVGRIEELLAPSPHRVESACPVSGRCGGCAFRQVGREHELALKRYFVAAAFRKNRLEVEVEEPLTDGRTTGYRNKVQYPIAPDGSYGYYARHSHEIIRSDTCLLSDPAFEPMAAFVSDYLRKSGARLRHLFLRRGQRTGETMLCLVSAQPSLPQEKAFAEEAASAFPSLRSILINHNPDDTNVILGKKVRVLFGEDRIEDILCGCRFGISSLSFYQVNPGAAELLYREAAARVSETGAKRLADLYCGAGTIGLSMAKADPSLSVTGVEVVPSAVENARRNARLNGIGNAGFLCADAVEAPLEGFDCVIVDPPRKGLSGALTERLIRQRPPRIVYVSCEPATLARDAAQLIGAGYTIGRVTPVDMFPGTGSVECVTDFTADR